MTKKELAEILDNCEYGKEGTPELWENAKKSGLVAVFGYSDDVTILKGAIDNEAGLTVFLDKNGIIANKCYDADCPYYLEKISNADVIRRNRTNFFTDLPHAKFFITEKTDIYCQGIVFNMDDISPVIG